MVDLGLIVYNRGNHQSIDTICIFPLPSFLGFIIFLLTPVNIGRVAYLVTVVAIAFERINFVTLAYLAISVKKNVLPCLYLQ